METNVPHPEGPAEGEDVGVTEGAPSELLREEDVTADDALDERVVEEEKGDDES